MEVELGLLLEKDYKYYEDIIKKNNKVIYESIRNDWFFRFIIKNHRDEINELETESVFLKSILSSF